ncbi:complement receptor type 2-like [Pituophis catenifer annectens]|uniref:complement receptor type 2-like n=1 Tax=Pituophis catenifer annectens TaxID=94852 RepID=UPI003992E323
MWSSPAPNCEGGSCGIPIRLDFADLTDVYQKMNSFPVGSLVQYKCNPGYFKHPRVNASSICIRNQVWSEVPEFCIMARCQSPQIKNGKIVAGVSSTYKYNQKVSFECIGDHKMVGSREIYCQVDGTWDPPTPVCEFVRQCPPPPDVQNGTCSNQETGVFSSGILVTYTCNPGYALIGKATLHCTNAGKWSSPAPNCEGKSCGHPGELEGGRLLVTGDFRFGSTVNYQCEEGYRLIGKSSRSCALFGETVAWTGDLPYCQIVQCQPPPDIQNGIHSNQETLFSSGTLVKYTCNPGYALIGEATIQCMDNGRWSSPVPNCEEIECKSPPDIQNGVHSNQEVIVFKRGMYVKYTCNFGYTLIGDATIHCTDSGTWTFPAPHCEKSQCSFPPSIANGKHDGLALQMFTFKMSVTYFCDPGYLLIGKASIFCGPSGNWSLPVPSCEGCLAPPNIAHSKRDKVTLEDFSYGTPVTYHCDPGFFLIGAFTARFLEHGMNLSLSVKEENVYMETTKLPSDSQVTKDGNNQIEKITGSFIKNTIHSEINKTTTKDLATTLTPGLGGESNIQRLPEQLNGGNQTDRLNGGNQTDAFPEVRNCSGEVDGCPLPPLSDSTEAETNSVIQTSANVILECENGYVRNDSSPIQAQQIGQDAPVPACVQSKQDSYSFATIGFEFCPISTLPVFEGSEPVFTFPFLTHYFKVTFKCKLGFKLISEHVFTMSIHDHFVFFFLNCFSLPPPGIYCGQPPNITDGFHNGNATTYPFGTKIHYRCNKNLSLIGASFMVCSANKYLEGLWKEKPPKCKGVFCKDPVVEHGIMITEPEKLYMYGSKVKFRCKIGYFMIGNYSIRCEKNSTWVPIEPSCKKISPGICGLPSILDGNIQPLQSQYETGKTAVITCNQNYSFIDDTITMTTQCQGYNLWNPPVQLCFFKTSPDNFQLFIKHGKIVYGKKKYYNPGDEVDIACHAGYVLIGPSKIKYIGGKKWLPSVPNCHLT